MQLSASLSLSGAPEVLVRDIAGAVEIEAIDGDQIVVSGRACGPATVQVDRAGAGVVVTVGGRPEELELSIGVPRTLARLRLLSTAGPVSVEGAAGTVVAEKLVGPLSLEDVGSVQVSGLTGPLSVENAASVTVRGSTGPVALEDIEGDALLNGVIGPVSAEGVRGRFANDGGTGPVSRQ